jgi:hypothetical protein
MSHVSELLCRAGESEKSLGMRAEAIAAAGREAHGWVCFWRAMAHHGLGNIDQATEQAARAGGKSELADSGTLGAKNSAQFEFMYRELTERLDKSASSPLPLSPLPPGEVAVSAAGEGDHDD